MKQIAFNQKRGFTLIELLVVIAIIGLLAAMSVIALNNARSRSRDARRLSDVAELKNAVELYYNDYGEYPLIANDNYDNSSDNNFISELTQKGILASDLIDPSNNKANFYYYYIGQNYSNWSGRCPTGSIKAIMFFLENDQDVGGFAIKCSTQNSNFGYGRCICLYP